MRNLRLHRDDEDTPLMHRAVARPSQTERPAPLANRPFDPVIADADATLDRMDRQIRNLKDLLGERFEGPDGPRAA